MVHPDTYVANTPKGFGLFAKRPFKRGEILWLLDDIDARIPLDTYLDLSPFQRRKADIYSYVDDQRRVIIPWDEGKYVNHACQPNSAGLLEYDNISIALGDIGAGQEIVEDYACYYGHFETFACRCGAPNCRGVVGPHNAPAAGRTDGRLRLADVAPLLLSLPQPLLDLRPAANDDFRQSLQAYAVTA